MTDEELQALLDESSLKTLKTQDEPKSDAQKFLSGKDGKSVIYRKGEIGDWRDHFTVAQNDMYDKILDEAMKDSMFTFKYE